MRRKSHEMIFLMSWLVGWYFKTRGMVECSEGGMSAAGSEVMNITRGMTKIRVRPDSLSCESQKAILAFSSFVRTK